MGLPGKRVRHLIDTYKFMVEHEETNVTRWSYYDEYLKSNIVKRSRREHPDLDKLIVTKIKVGEIATARDVRDRLVKLLDVSKVGPEPTKILMSGTKTFERAYDSALDRGVDNVWLRRLKRFKGELQVSAFLLDLERMPEDQRKKCLYEIRKIEQALSSVTGRGKS